MLITSRDLETGEQELGRPGDRGPAGAARGPRGVRRAGRAVPADGLRDRPAAAGQRQRCAGADPGGLPARPASGSASSASPSGSPAGCGRSRCAWRSTGRRAGWLRPASRRACSRGPTERCDEPLEQLISRERAERLWEALGRLKSLDREALDAFYIRGHSLIEIAEMLDVPLGTVKRRLHTARKRLKVELEASVADAEEWTDWPQLELEMTTTTSSSSSAPAPATSRPGRNGRRQGQRAR